MVTGNYDGSGNYVLTTEGGEVHMSIAPMSTFGIGNSIGGYFARPIRYAGQKMLSIVRIGGSETRLSPETLSSRHGQEKGFILRPGMKGLWATSSGSARKGVFHPIRETNDPIILALREIKMPSSLLQEVESIDLDVLKGGDLCSHSVSEGDYWLSFKTDGQAKRTHDGEFVKSHFNQFHVGCMSSPATYHITGGTYVVQSGDKKAMNGFDYPYIGKITVTKSADRGAVAGLILAAFYKGADKEYLDALRNPEVARQWITDRYELARAPEGLPKEASYIYFHKKGEIDIYLDGFSITDTGKVYSLSCSTSHVITPLISRHGFGIAELPAQTRELVDAMRNQEAARTWLTTNYSIEMRADGRAYFALRGNDKRLVISYGPESKSSDIVMYTYPPIVVWAAVELVVKAHGWDFVKTLI
jgi:hypothetical protein